MASDTIVVDWGTSAFRAWRIGAGGGVRDMRADAQGGILHVEAGAFEGALRRRVGDWLAPGTTVWLAGMVTSRNGWVEAPYVPVPATLRDLAHAAVAVSCDDAVELRFVPGVSQRAPSPDVMRGEEMQVFGQLGGQGDGLFVLPGTHAKWVQVRDAAIHTFRTCLTGEMYALLTRHSIVGRLIPAGGGAPREAAFDDGVRAALELRPGGLLHDVFTARSAVLLGQIEAADVADYLSGLLIGHELRECRALPLPGQRPVLVGDAALVARYRRAFELAAVPVAVGHEDAALLGLLALASTASREEG